MARKEWTALTRQTHCVSADDGKPAAKESANTEMSIHISADAADREVPACARLHTGNQFMMNRLV